VYIWITSVTNSAFAVVAFQLTDYGTTDYGTGYFTIGWAYEP